MSGVEVIAVISDVHWPHTHLATWRAFRAWHAEVRPHRTIVLGDFFDLPMLSTFDPEPDQGVQLLPPLKSGAHQLRELSEECGRLDFVEGNHEHRYHRKVVAPLTLQLAGLEHCVSLQALCRVHGLPESIVWHVEQPPEPTIRVGNWVLRHGHRQSGRWGGGVMPARSLLLKEAHRTWSALVGHYHRPQIVTQGDRTYAVNPHMEADVSFTGGIDGWCRGWSVLYRDVDRDWCHIVQHRSNDGRFVIGGRVYDGRAEGASVGAAVAREPQDAPDHPVRPAIPVDQEPDLQPRTAEARSPDRPVEIVTTAAGREVTYVHWPDDSGMVARQNTGEVGRRYGLTSVTVRDRMMAWERRYGRPRTEMTRDQVADLLGRPLAN